MPFCMWKHTDTSTRIKKTELAQYARVPVIKKERKRMGTYNSRFRTNFFTVTDKQALFDLMKGFIPEVKIREGIRPDGKTGFALDGIFYGSTFNWYPPVTEKTCKECELAETCKKEKTTEGREECRFENGDIFEFYPLLQKILPEGEAAIFECVGFEKLKSLDASLDFVTKDEIITYDFEKLISNTAEQVFGNSGFEDYFFID